MTIRRIIHRSLPALRACAATSTAAGLLVASILAQSPDGMRAIVVAGATPEVRRVPVPEPVEGEVRLRVRAAAVNPVDWRYLTTGRAGGPPAGAPRGGGPRGGGPARPGGPANPQGIPGFDAAGVIDRVGPGVTSWKAGDEIIAFLDARGAYADYAVAPVSAIVAKPTSISFEQAAGIPTVAFAAYSAVVDIADVQKGQRVLIHGGAGGVGSAAVQIAKSRGAHVLATASARNHAFLRSIGVDEPIDYTAVRFETVAKDLDVVINTVDADTAARSVSTLRRGGTLVSIAGQVPEAACTQAGIRCSMRTIGTPVGQVLRDVVALVRDGRYDVNVDAAFPLERTAEAWSASQTGRTRGKIIITLGE